MKKTRNKFEKCRQSGTMWNLPFSFFYLKDLIGNGSTEGFMKEDAE